MGLQALSFWTFCYQYLATVGNLQEVLTKQLDLDEKARIFGPVKNKRKKGEKPTEKVRVAPRRQDSEDSEESSESDESAQKRDHELVSRKESGVTSIKASDIGERKPALAVVNAGESISEQSSESEEGLSRT